MARYHLVRAGQVVDAREFSTSPPTLAPNKGAWLAEVVEAPAYDPASQVLAGDTLTVAADHVVRSQGVRDKTADEIAAMRRAKRDAIDAAFATRAYAPIDHAVGGTSYTFDADKDAIENILGVVVQINAGLSVPDPRPWTPHGALTPLQVSHAELIGLGAAIAARKDTLFAVKKAKEAALIALATPAEIAAFDPDADWTA